VTYRLPQIHHADIFTCWIRPYPLEYARTAHIVGTGSFSELCAFLSIKTFVQIEREMGSGGFIITYFAAGIFGFVYLTFLHIRVQLKPL
jgi:hypothetical protein